MVHESLWKALLVNAKKGKQEMDQRGCILLYLLSFFKLFQQSIYDKQSSMFLNVFCLVTYLV